MRTGATYSSLKTANTVMPGHTVDEVDIYLVSKWMNSLDLQGEPILELNVD